jgi:hypothetical protein
MEHRMMEPESDFRSRMKQFVFGKDVTGLLEKTACICVPVVVGGRKGRLWELFSAPFPPPQPAASTFIILV